MDPKPEPHVAQQIKEPKKPHYLIQFFNSGHLPENIGRVSSYFKILAEKIDEHLPDNPEKTTALRKLLEAKDCAVRAVIFNGKS